MTLIPQDGDGLSNEDDPDDDGDGVLDGDEDDVRPMRGVLDIFDISMSVSLDLLSSLETHSLLLYKSVNGWRYY